MESWIIWLIVAALITVAVIRIFMGSYLEAMGGS